MTLKCMEFGSVWNSKVIQRQIGLASEAILWFSTQLAGESSLVKL